MISISEYIEKNLPHTKEGIISLIKASRRDIHKEMRENPSHSLPYYNGLISLFEKVLPEIESRRVFDAPENWFYSFSITNTNAALYLRHIAGLKEEEGKILLDIDETFRLINYPVKQFSVEEYAAATNTEAVTVRQWIRRGKLRNALKVGSEWRIPEITDPPRRGYTPVSYYNKGGLIAFPKEFGVSLSIQPPHVIDIYQSPERKGYVVLIDKAPAFFPSRLLSEAEREKLELLLISNPNITSSASTVGSWPKYEEVEKYRTITRCGDTRLPDDWDENLF